ncbi:DUF2490 domain-containing protein [Maribacter sp. 2307ULW6-5]|uniref:DUF2490 domain-containing protein n=1 Tax=Maribacter sp. 2307ULW6-5 TaxID=3386275 RepID=UPI0039BC3641
MVPSRNLVSALLSIILTALANMGQIAAQESLKDGMGTWYMIDGNNKILPKWSIPVTGILREYKFIEEEEFAFVQLGVRYQAGHGISLGVGAAYLNTVPFAEDEFDTRTLQHWAYEEIRWKQGPIISHRLKLEHRWIAKADDSFLNHRARYRLQFKKNLTKKLFVKCSEEAFFNLNRGRMDQNRFFLGLGHALDPNLSVELGYMKNHINKNNFDRIRLTVYFKTDLFSKKQNLAVAQQNGTPPNTAD